VTKNKNHLNDGFNTLVL